MKRRLICCMIIIVGVNIASADAFAKTFAWLIDTVDSKAQKLDVDTNKIIQTVTPNKLYSSSELQEWESALIADPGSNLLFVIYDYPGRFMGQGIKIYNLKDLSFKKDLGITSKSPDLDLPKLVVPPIGNKFYVIWWDRAKEVNGEGGETYSVYDKTSLTKINDLQSLPINLYKPWMIYSDGSKIYSINIKKNEIYVYDSSTLQLKETISIANIWGAPLFLKHVVSNDSYLGMGDKILFLENIKSNKSDPNNIRYFVYSFSSKGISNKVPIKEDGEEALTPDGNKIIINETQYVRNESDTVKEIKYLNKVNIYDIAIGQKVKYLDLNDKYKSVSISGISPDSSKLYLAAENIQTGATTIIIIGLTPPYNIVAQIPVEGTWMIFFEDQ